MSVEQKQAKQNPWYCLATLFGEPRDAGGMAHMRSRTAWNRWLATGLDENRRKRLIEHGAVDDTLVPILDSEVDELTAMFRKRTGDCGSILPNPGGIIDFQDIEFGEVDFSHFIFTNVADFTASKFHDQANFSSAIFLDGARFHSSEFFLNAIFLFSKFIAVADFRLVTFGRHAEFRSATFLSATDFSSATFSSKAFFHAAEFARKITFVSATFRNSTIFDFAKFLGDANFAEATFESDVNFRSSVFAQAVCFKSVIFQELVVFQTASFKGETQFMNAHFERSVPDFRGATMHEATEWHDAKWPDPPIEKEAAQAQLYRWERLKQEMERLKKHEDELTFFRKEMRARRGLYERRSAAWLLNRAYELLSNYGESIARPLLLLIASILVGGAALGQLPTAHHGAPLRIVTAFYTATPIAGNISG